MSSKTLKSSDAKTGSEPKRRQALNYWLIFLILLNLCLVGFILAAKYAKDSGPCLRVESNKCAMHLILAQTQEQHQKGLGDRDSLPKNQGMLFRFERPGIQCFWMKEMRFPIDIIWINANKQIVDIKENVLPNTYPESFCSDQLTQYVLEVNANYSKELGLKVNQQLSF